MMIRIWGAALFLSTLISLAHAGSISGVDFKDQVTVDGKPLVLNGMGLRQATIFKVNVYAAALYVSAKTQNGGAILADPSPKQVELKFMRNVGADDIKKAWNESLKKLCGASCAQKDNINQFLSWVTDVKKSDSLVYIFRTDRMELSQDGKTVGTIASGEFGKMVLSVWLGEDSKYPALKSGLLGTGG